MTDESMDLVCYKYDGWGPRIRPASPKRQWMEETNERYAYRCLPLAIANAHGWEILSPVAFEARWSGGTEMESVEIRMDPGYETHLEPVSLFGYGTITFHIEGIFRTPPGWNLWVSGSPNKHKDGIQALGGVIETDWSPYTFTMNWRFTRPGHWVRFEENEPIAFIFPVERGRVEQFQPRIAPLDGDLKRQFEAWSESRAAFQRWVVETNPPAPADKWQKLYYRGLDADGRQQVDDHQAKLRVRPFRNADGTVMEPGEATACPMRHGAARPAALQASAQNVLFAREPAAELDPGGNPGLTLALNRIGFDAKPQAGPMFELPAQAGEPVDLALKRRDWIMQTAMRQRQLSARTAGVPRVRRPSGQEFLDRFYALSRPVVIEGVLKARDAAALERESRQLKDYLAPGHGAVAAETAGDFTPLQFALANQLIAQVSGARRLILAPPSETSRLYHRRGLVSEVRDLADDDRLAAFPLAREALTFEVDLDAGELLYVPLGWWVQSTAVADGEAVTYTSFRWPNEGQAAYPQD